MPHRLATSVASAGAMIAITAIILMVSGPAPKVPIVTRKIGTARFASPRQRRTHSEATGQPYAMPDSLKEHTSLSVGRSEEMTVNECIAETGNPYGLVEAAVYGGLRTDPHRPTLFKMAVIGGKDHVSRTILRSGKWEIRSLDGIAELFHPDAVWKLNLTTAPEAAVAAGKPRPTFLDIGGNVGYYSLLAANSGYNTITIEPMTRNRAAIKASLCANPSISSRVKLVATALGDNTSLHQHCRIQSLIAANGGNGVLHCQSEPFGPCPPDLVNGCEDIQSMTLDHLLDQVNPKSIDVMKVDIEEYECTMLKGATTLFTKWRPRVVQFEMNSKKRDCIPPLMASHGYIKGSFTGDDINTVWLLPEAAKTVQSLDDWCRPWRCSCEGMSEVYGRTPLSDGRTTMEKLTPTLGRAAPFESRALDRWWKSHKCNKVSLANSVVAASIQPGHND